MCSESYGAGRTEQSPRGNARAQRRRSAKSAATDLARRPAEVPEGAELGGEAASGGLADAPRRPAAQLAVAPGGEGLGALRARPTGAAAAPWAGSGGGLAAASREPSEDQISTLVRIFSTTASVNSVVVACPPRSIVFTPPAAVSRTVS